MSDPTDGGHVNIWANSPDVKARVHSDARLHSRDEPEKALDFNHAGAGFVKLNNTWGQAGWDKGLNFSSSENLLQQLEKLKAEGRIKGVFRLAIHAHGLPGQVYMDGQDKDPITGRDFQSKALFKRLKPFFPSHGGQLVFMGCNAGQGAPGFLEQVSLALPNVEIVAFETVGYVEAGAMTRKGQSGNETEPGMRITDFTENVFPTTPEIFRARKKFYDDNWSNLSVLPWATRHSKHAVVAINGRVIKHTASTRLVKKRDPLISDLPPHKGFPQARQEAEQVVLTVELTDAESAVFVALPQWQDVNTGKAKPIPPAGVPAASGLPRHRAEQAVRKLSNKSLIMITQKNGVSGYVRLR